MTDFIPWGKAENGQMRPIQPGDEMVVEGGSAIPGLVDQRQELFTPTTGQTVFNLAATPSDPNDVQFYVNSLKYSNTTHYTTSGSQVTWNDSAFTLDGNDGVEIVYFV